jgi:hypothetical protein
LKKFTRKHDEAISWKLVDTNIIYIDGTHIKANANTKKNIKVQVQKESKHYKKQFLKEINADRQKHGKKIKGKEKLGLLSGIYSTLYAFLCFLKRLFRKNIFLLKKAA